MNCLLLAVLLSCAGTLRANDNEVTYRGVRYSVVRIDPQKTELRSYWRDAASKKPYLTYKNLQANLDQRIVFFVNGGIFEKGYTPLGLYVEKGKELVPLNQKDAPGNFYLKPNGVFFIENNGKAGVMETGAYTAAKKTVRLAVQSGPLLLDDGKVHPKFNEPSKNRLIRNGVGVDRQGRMVFLATVRDQPKFGNLWEFATLFRDRFDCPNALFLDGDISFQLPNPTGQERTSGYASMLVVLEKDPPEQPVPAPDRATVPPK